MTIFKRETWVERRQPSVRWGALFAGSFVSIAVGFQLQELVLGVGLSSIDPNGGALGSIGVATGWAFAAVTILALFVGGLVTARLSGIRARGVTALHGGVMWALTTTFATVLALWAIGSVTQLGSPADQVAASARAGEEAGHALLWLTLANIAGLLAAVIGGALGAASAATVREDVVVATPPA